MERVPLDLRRPEKRREYLENHKKWFLQHHENAIKKFEDSVEAIYGKGTPSSSKQLRLFEEREQHEPNKSLEGPAGGPR